MLGVSPEGSPGAPRPDGWSKAAFLGYHSDVHARGRKLDRTVRPIERIQNGREERIFRCAALLEVHHISNGEIHPVLVRRHRDQGLDASVLNPVLLNQDAPRILRVLRVGADLLVHGIVNHPAREDAVAAVANRYDQLVPEKRARNANFLGSS